MLCGHQLCACATWLQPAQQASGPEAGVGMPFNPNVVTTPACIEVLLADAKGSATEDSGWNGSQEQPACDAIKPDRTHCPVITVKGDPGHFDASASASWQNRPIALAAYGQMSLDYSPVLTGTIVCPSDGRAEIHWEEIKPGFWKSATSATAAACQECIAGSTRWGWPFVYLVVVAALLYVGGGLIYNSKRRGAKLGVEALPHRAFWASVASLVLDGVAFARAPNRRQKGYTRQVSKPAADSPAASFRVPAEQDSKHPTQQKKKEKKQKKEKAPSKQQRESERSLIPPEAAVEPAAAEPAAAALPPPASGSTASGGGGRWVHLPG